MKKQKSKGKKVNFELITRDEVCGQEPYKLLDEIRRKHHEHLADAEIAVAWRKETKPDKDGHVVLGKCVKVAGLYREMLEYDFVIVLNREAWNLGFSVEQKTALIDHELCHAEVQYDDETGEIKYDELGRKQYRLRKHDIEEFQAIVQRHGCYKRDLERFAEVLMKKAKNPLFAEAAKAEGKDGVAVQ